VKAKKKRSETEIQKWLSLKRRKIKLILRGEKGKFIKEEREIKSHFSEEGNAP